MNFSTLIDKYFIKNPKLRRAVTILIEGNRDRQISLIGNSMTVNSVREHGYLRASRTSEYFSVFRDEASVLLSLSFCIPNIDTVVDAGANIGLFSLTLGRFQKLHPQLQIFAFEADPDTFTRLAKNLNSKNQKAFNIGVSDSSKVETFVRGAVSHVTTTKAHSNAYSLDESFEVECRRLDSFDIPGSRILLKIDVEGQELEVIQGASQWFIENRCAVVYLDGIEQRSEVLEILSGYNFEFFDGRTLGQFTNETFSVLAIHREWINRISNNP